MRGQRWDEMIRVPVVVTRNVVDVDIRVMVNDGVVSN